MFGLLNINKPSGLTSRAVVNNIERLTRPFKAGHAGTLDPLATGVLIVGVGPATRLLEYVQQMPKTYRATFLFGQYSETDDIEGEVEILHNPEIPSLNDIGTCVDQFCGTILQRPPKYSALKIGGRRAYDLARRGKSVELSARPVTIHSLRIICYAYPKLKLELTCSGGTYVRSIGRDLATALGTSAVMSSLCRTAVGNFTERKSTSLQHLHPGSFVDHLLPPQLAVTTISPHTLSDEQAKDISYGRKIEVEPRENDSMRAETMAAFWDGTLIAILRRGGPNQWHPQKVFSTPGCAATPSRRL